MGAPVPFTRTICDASRNGPFRKRPAAWSLDAPVPKPNDPTFSDTYIVSKTHPFFGIETLGRSAVVKFVVKPTISLTFRGSAAQSEISSRLHFSFFDAELC